MQVKRNHTLKNDMQNHADTKEFRKAEKAWASHQPFKNWDGVHLESSEDDQDTTTTFMTIGKGPNVTVSEVS